MKYLVTYIENDVPRQKVVNSKLKLLFIKNKVEIKIINENNQIVGKLK